MSLVSMKLVLGKEGSLLYLSALLQNVQALSGSFSLQYMNSFNHMVRSEQFSEHKKRVKSS